MAKRGDSPGGFAGSIVRRARRLVRKLLGRPPRKPPLIPGVTLVGYPFVANGLGQALRAMATPLAARGIDTAVFDVGRTLPRDDDSVAALATRQLTRRINILCINANRLEGMLTRVGRGGRYNIARPFWELPRLHPDWTAGLNRADEIWGASRFIVRAFEEGCARPVLLMPPAVSVPPGIVPQRDAFGLEADRLTFMFAFDVASFPARKNPLAVLEAFRRAFGSRPAARVALVLKLHGEGPERAATMAAIEAYRGSDPRIVVIDRTLVRGDLLRLIASIDVFVSLHRSEGFGLLLAEAMLMGKAVVSTDYSGTTDFVTPATGFPVPCRLIEVQPGDYPYHVPGQLWADPDIDAAAAIMSQLAEAPELARARAEAGRAFIADAYSAPRIGCMLAERIAEIERGMDGR